MSYSDQSNKVWSDHFEKRAAESVARIEHDRKFDKQVVDFWKEQGKRQADVSTHTSSTSKSSGSFGSTLLQLVIVGAVLLWIFGSK